MPQAEPKQHTKSDGTDGAMSIEIDLDTGATTEPVQGESPDRTQQVAPEAPKSLDLGTPADRPAWLDPRFASPEAMATAYRELESKLGQPKPVGEKPADKAPVQPNGLTDAELAAYGQEVVSSGKLSEASYTALAAKGIPRALADAHVEGIQLKRERLMADAVKPFGSLEAYRSVAQWATQNMTPAEQAQYNADVNSGDINRVLYAVNGLQARHAMANNKPAQPQLVHGRRSTGAPAGGFSSMAQQVSAMQDPRYQSDPAYRDEVIRMVRESTGY